VRYGLSFACRRNAVTSALEQLGCGELLAVAKLLPARFNNWDAVK
jgi:hypothetical protein